ncbi:MAG: hypothetical protein JXB17_06605 [Bacteroidales bacterium]|nr:hypothetical protein [Bacteroidales bacterium]
MRKSRVIVFVLLVSFKGLFGQINNQNQYNIIKQQYIEAFDEMKLMLKDSIPLNFKRAVFLNENAYYEGNLDYEKYIQLIDFYVFVINSYIKANPLPYKGTDYDIVSRNYGIYKFMTDTIWLTKDTAIHYPYKYNFEDYAGEKDWASMYVTTLIETGKGNCHSMPFLYKILAEELGADAYLSLAPYHMYIKSKSEKTGWYNTELTNGMFPVDAWVAASGYVSLEAMQNGIYMDTLGLKQSIAFCIYDLAKGCEKKLGFKEFPFIFDCLDLALKYYPNFINAMIYKAECLKKRFDIYMELYEANDFNDILDIEEPKTIFTEMENLYVEILNLGFREMPPKMYKEWINSLKENKTKYQNNKILIIFNQN